LRNHFLVNVAKVMVDEEGHLVMLDEEGDVIGQMNPEEAADFAGIEANVNFGDEEEMDFETEEFGAAEEADETAEGLAVTAGLAGAVKKQKKVKKRKIQAKAKEELPRGKIIDFFSILVVFNRLIG